MLKRSDLLVFAAACCVFSLNAGSARAAGPMGQVTGRVVSLTGNSIGISSGNQIVHFVLPMPFTAVYLADKSRADLTNISLGMTVRVVYNEVRSGQPTAREIDILAM